MEDPELQGVFGIVPTPLTEKGDVDEPGLMHLVEHCADSGLHAAVILGSNGEFPYFSTEEKVAILRAAAKAGRGKIKLVGGVSAFSTRESVELSRVCKDAGYDAVMAALNVYFQVDLDAVKKHYASLSDRGGLPVIFYYFPEVTGLVLAPDEIAEIAAIPGVHGAKISVMNRSFLKRVIKATRTQLWAVFAGSALLMREALKQGAAGIVCPLPLIAPGDCLKLYELMEKGKFDEAQAIQDKLLGALPLFTDIEMPDYVSAAYFKAKERKPYTGPPERPVSTVTMVKEALKQQGHPVTSVVRSPNNQLNADQERLVAKTLKAQGWI